MAELKLERPIVCFDLESTGVVPARDRIVELAVLKIHPDGHRRSAVTRLNPGIPIPPSATAVHGITDADVADAPSFPDVAEKLWHFLDGCDLAGYNIQGFDVPMLQCEFARAGLEFKLEGRRLIDAYTIFCKLYPRTLSAAYEFFCGAKLEGAHGAEADTAATWEVLLGQLAKHPELPNEVAALAAFCDARDPDAVDRTRRFKWRDGEVVVNFGKNAGRPLREIAVQDPGFLNWIIRNDFPDEVKEICRNALRGIFPERKAENGAES